MAHLAQVSKGEFRYFGTLDLHMREETEQPPVHIGFGIATYSSLCPHPDAVNRYNRDNVLNLRRDLSDFTDKRNFYSWYSVSGSYSSCPCRLCVPTHP